MTSRVSGNTVNLTFPSSQFVNQTKVLTTFIVPKHIWSNVKDPSTETNQNPIGTGPYTLKTFTPQTVTLTERASGYWQALPKVKEIRYTSYNDNNAQTTALANGACEWSFVFISNYKAVYTNKDPEHYQLWFPPTLGAHGLWFNTQKKPWDNASLRRAVSMVINRDDIFTQGEAGYFYPKIDSVTGIPTPAGDSFISADYKGKTQGVDVAGAKTLLTSAGFTFAGNTLKDPSGKAVTLTLSDPAGWSDYQTDLEIIKDNLSQIGITAKIDKANQDAWFKNVDTGNFDAVLHWTNSGATPYDMYENIMDGAIYKPVGTAGVAGNYGRFQSPEATAALKAVRHRERRRHPHRRSEHAPEDHGRADADGGADGAERRWRILHQELDRLAGRLQPVRPGAADPAQRAGRRDAPAARLLTDCAAQ